MLHCLENIDSGRTSGTNLPDDNERPFPHCTQLSPHVPAQALTSVLMRYGIGHSVAKRVAKGFLSYNLLAQESSLHSLNVCLAA